MKSKTKLPSLRNDEMLKKTFKNFFINIFKLPLLGKSLALKAFYDKKST